MGFYAPSQLLQDARRHGVELRPVDVNRSAWDCSLEDPAGGPALSPALRLGLRLVKGLSAAVAERLVDVRAQQRFADVGDLARRARLTRGDLEALAAAGALRALAGHRHRARWDCAGVEAPLPVLGDADIAEATPLLRRPTEAQDIVADYASQGGTLGRHPLALLRGRLTAQGMVTTRTLQEAPTGVCVRLAGLVTCRQRPGSAAGVVFVTLEDEAGSAQVVVRPTLVERDRRPLLEARLLVVTGELQRNGEVVHVIARRLEDMSILLGSLEAVSRDFH